MEELGVNRFFAFHSCPIPGFCILYSSVEYGIPGRLDARRRFQRALSSA